MSGNPNPNPDPNTPPKPGDLSKTDDDQQPEESQNSTPMEISETVTTTEVRTSTSTVETTASITISTSTGTRTSSGLTTTESGTGTGTSGTTRSVTHSSGLESDDFWKMLLEGETVEDANMEDEETLLGPSQTEGNQRVEPSEIDPETREEFQEADEASRACERAEAAAAYKAKMEQIGLPPTQLPQRSQAMPPGWATEAKQIISQACERARLEQELRKFMGLDSRAPRNTHPTTGERTRPRPTTTPVQPDAEDLADVFASHGFGESTEQMETDSGQAESTRPNPPSHSSSDFRLDPGDVTPPADQQQEQAEQEQNQQEEESGRADPAPPKSNKFWCDYCGRRCGHKTAMCHTVRKARKHALKAGLDAALAEQEQLLERGFTQEEAEYQGAERGKAAADEARAAYLADARARGAELAKKHGETKPTSQTSSSQTGPKTSDSRKRTSTTVSTTDSDGQAPRTQRDGREPISRQNSQQPPVRKFSKSYGPQHHQRQDAGDIIREGYEAEVLEQIRLNQQGSSSGRTAPVDPRTMRQISQQVLDQITRASGELAPLLGAGAATAVLDAIRNQINPPTQQRQPPADQQFTLPPMEPRPLMDLLVPPPPYAPPRAPPTPQRQNSRSDSERSSRGGRGRGRGQSQKSRSTCKPPSDEPRRDEDNPPKGGSSSSAATHEFGRRGGHKSSGFQRSGSQRSGFSRSHGTRWCGATKEACVEKHRNKPQGFDAGVATDIRMSKDYTPMRYFISKRVADVAIGILADPNPIEPTRHAPLFMQFGFRDRPNDAHTLIVGDVVRVHEFVRLLKPNGEPRGWQSGVLDPSTFIVRGQSSVIAACAATNFEKLAGSRLPKHQVLGIITKNSSLSDEVGHHFRWECDMVSMYHQDPIPVQNYHIPGATWPNGFADIPRRSEHVWAHCYGTQKNQTLFIGDLHVPQVWAEYARACPKASAVLMWIEKPTTEIINILHKNDGLGPGNHTPESYKTEYPIIQMANTAAACAEREKHTEEMRRVRVPVEIEDIDDGRIYNLKAVWPENPHPNIDPVPERVISAYAKHLQPVALARLQREVAPRKWVNMFQVITLETHAPHGPITKLKVQRVIERYSVKAKIKPTGVDEHGNLSVFQLAHGIKDQLQIDDEEDESPEDEEATKVEESLTAADENKYFNGRFSGHGALRLIIDEYKTGLEPRVTLLASAPCPKLVPGKCFDFKSSREELLSILTPTKDVVEPVGLHPEPNMPRNLGACPKFHESPPGVPNFATGEWDLYQRGPDAPGAQREYLAQCVPIKEVEGRRDIRQALDVWDLLVADQSLNEKQKLAVYATIFADHPGGFVQAPPGSGKTYLLGIITKYKNMLHPKEGVLAVAVTNLAVLNLAEKICQAKGIDANDEGVADDTIVILSTHAQLTSTQQAHELGANYDTDFLRRISIVAHAKELIRRREENLIGPEIVSKAQLRRLRRYVAVKEEFPHDLTDDEYAIRHVLLKQNKIRNVICTVSKAQQLSKQFHGINLLLVDECGQVRLTDVQTLIWHTNVEQMVVTGDIQQLPPYVQHDWALITGFKFGQNSVADHFSKWLPDRTITLDTVYRFHPGMVPSISYAFYDGHLICGTNPVDRRMARDFGIPVVSETLPITLIHTDGREEPAAGTSLQNPSQELIAVAIIRMLRARTPQATVTVVCYYGGSARRMEEAVSLILENEQDFPLVHRKVQVHTVHSYIGREADFVITLTTRTRSPTTSSREFVHEARTACVALTRAREAAFVIGDMNYLYGRYVSASQQEADHAPKAAFGRLIHRVSRDSPPVIGERYAEYLDWIRTQPIANTRPIYSGAQGDTQRVLLDNRDNTSFVAGTLPGGTFHWHIGGTRPGEQPQNLWTTVGQRGRGARDARNN